MSEQSGSVAPTTPGEITRLLQAHHQGDDDAFGQLVPLVYDEMLVIARQQLSRWRPGATLDTTGLAHEAYLRLVGQTLVEFEGRHHFYAIAARSMRLILVDYARGRFAKKRGEGQPPVSLDQVEPGYSHEVETVLSIDSALNKLAQVNERSARVFECRFFGGLSVQETASALNLSLRTVHREWLKSKGFLRRQLS